MHSILKFRCCLKLNFCWLSTCYLQGSLCYTSGRQLLSSAGHMLRNLRARRPSVLNKKCQYSESQQKQYQNLSKTETKNGQSKCQMYANGWAIHSLKTNTKVKCSKQMCSEFNRQHAAGLQFAKIVLEPIKYEQSNRSNRGPARYKY